MPALPIEIWEIVLDLLDPTSLSACILVCKDWVPRSRPKLFKCLRMPIRRVQALADLKLTDGCLFSNHVERLCLHARYINPWSPGGHPILSDLARIPAIFPSLSTLQFEGCSLFVKDDVFLGQHIGRRTVTHIELETCRFSSKASFQTFLSFFPCLNTLTLRIIQFFYSVTSGVKDGTAPGPEYLTELRCLSVYSDDLVTATDSFMRISRQRAQSIPCLECRFISRHNIANVALLLRDQGADITSLSLSFLDTEYMEIKRLGDGDRRRADLDHILDLSVHEGLRSFHVCDIQSLLESQAWIFSALSSLCQVDGPTRLETISFRIRPFLRFAVEDFWDWDVFCDLLQRPQFVNIQRVCIEIRAGYVYSPALKEVVSSIYQQLSPLKLRDILVIVRTVAC